MRKRILIIFSVFLIVATLLTTVGCDQLNTESTPKTPLPESTPKAPPPNNSISGHVYEADGKTPVVGARIEAREADDYHKKIVTAETNAGGWYIVTDLTAGDYIVGDKAEGYRFESYGDFDYTDPPGGIRPRVTVIDNIATTGVDIRLKALASISGHIYRTDNKKPIAGARVNVYGSHWSTGPRGSNTSTDGSYTVTGLNAGESTVAVQAAGYVTRYYNGASGTYVPSEGEKVITSFGKITSDIDFFLEWGGSISGRVFMPDGRTPAYEASIDYVQISGDRTPRLGGCTPMPPRDSGKSDSSGNYQIGGLLSGDYDLLVRYKFGEEILYSRAIISVTKGEETRDLDFTLEPGGSISGYVYQNDGITPVAGQSVTAHMAGVSDFSTKATQDGSYSLKNLPPGECEIRGEIITISSGENTIHDIILPE